MCRKITFQAIQRNQNAPTGAGVAGRKPNIAKRLHAGVKPMTAAEAPADIDVQGDCSRPAGEWEQARKTADVGGFVHLWKTKAGCERLWLHWFTLILAIHSSFPFRRKR